MMLWQLGFHKRAQKQMHQLPKQAQKRITDFFETRVLSLHDPLVLAKSLAGDMAGLWRFRVGEYRIITTIDKGKMIILALEIGHRKEIYKLIQH